MRAAVNNRIGWAGLGFWSRSHALVLALYLGTAPVYWIPWLSASSFYLIKAALFALAVLFPLLMALVSWRFRFPGGASALALFLVFSCLSVPGVLIGYHSGNQQEAVTRIFNIAQIILFVFSCGHVVRQGLVWLVSGASVVILVISCAVSYSLMALSPGMQNPLVEGLTVADTGLGGVRTGWAPSIALYLPWMYAVGQLPWMIRSVGIVSILLNLLQVASRAGYLAAGVPFAAWTALTKRPKVLVSVILVGCGLTWYAANNLEALRLHRGGVGSISALNELSTGRVEQYLVAVDAIAVKPLFGHGVGRVLFESDYWKIHNTFLKLAVEGGVGFAVAALMLVAFPFARLVRERRWMTSGWRLPALLTILGGITTSMVEPGVMFGAFNQVAFWWFCYAICVSRDGKVRNSGGQ